MIEVIAALSIFAIALSGMAVGVIFSNKRLKGSCGGLANLKDQHGEVTCAICGDPSESCKGEEDGKAREAAVTGSASAES